MRKEQYKGKAGEAACEAVTCCLPSLTNFYQHLLVSEAAPGLACSRIVKKFFLTSSARFGLSEACQVAKREMFK